MGNESDLPTLPMTSDSGETRADGSATYGRFISLGVIGRGGMGLVLRARDPELDRHVALKLLAPSQYGEADPTSVQRLHREAQAMAKLQHPNVVTVYEMGQIGAERFIAMELVEGTTLRRWLADGGHPWREIVAAFVQCGRGLEAAHAAGLVHRDFKPENVLIGADRRPRVTDFGLVASGVPFGSSELGDVSTSSELTVRGAVIGTPMYMSPEQWTGQEVDARTDQFAFCVALWEGVFGQRPFEGTSASELRAHVLTGKVRPPPRTHPARKPLEDILRRGLAPEYTARWPSMTALLAVLDRPHRRRWPWAAGAVGLAGSAAAAAVLLTATPASDPCPDPRSKLTGIWDAATAARLTAAFTAANPAIASDTIARVIPALDTYASAWRSASIAACRATRVEGTQSEQLLDERVACLDRLRADLGGLTAALGTADRDRVAGAVDAVGVLGDIEACNERDRWLMLPPPTDPDLRRRYDELDHEIAATHSMKFTGKAAERQTRALAIVAEARDLGHLPMLVFALEELHDAAHINSDVATNEATLRELAQKAAEARHDKLAATAWIDLIRILSQRHKRDEAKALEPVAAAAVARTGSPSSLRYRFLIAKGVRHQYAQEWDEAIAALRDAVDRAPSDVDRATAELTLAQVMNHKSGPKEALPLAEKGLATTQTAYGPTSPLTADALHVVAEFQLLSGQIELARTNATRALTIKEAGLTPDHRELGIELHLLANIAVRSGDRKQARELYQRAIPIFEAARGVEDAALSKVMLAGLVSDEDGLVPEGKRLYEEGLAGLAQTLGSDSLQYARMAGNYAQRLFEAGRCDEARPHIEHVMAVFTRINPREISTVLELSAKCHAAQKRWPEAITTIKRARELCAKTCGFDEWLMWELGQYLVESRLDRAGGLALVDQAAGAATEHDDKELLAKIEAWRKQRR